MMKAPQTVLRRIRREREITMDEVHLKTGLNVSTLSKVERRLLPITDKQRTLLAKFFKVPEETLLDDAGV